MRVFITGATGFIGMAVTSELIGAGHSVIGLARDPAKASALAALGAEVVMGSLEDPDGLATHAGQADGVIHCAFNHDFSKIVDNAADDRRAIEAIGAALKGTDKPLIATGGILGLAGPGEMATEQDQVAPDHPFPRRSEQAARALADAGVHAMTMRLSQIHDPRKQGLITYYIAIARERGFLGYAGDGSSRWAAAHLGDVARLYRLALEQGKPGAAYHAVGEEGVAMRAIADTLSARIGLPTRSLDADEAADYFGWMAHFATTDFPASSALTQEWLGWKPTGPGLLSDLAQLAE